MSRKTSGWVVVGKKEILKTPYVSFEAWQVRHKTDASNTLRDFSMVLARDYIAVIGRTETGQAVLCIEDHVADGLDLQVACGAINKGETALAAAQREFGEESGWHAQQLIPLGAAIPQNDRIVSATEGNDGAKTCYMFLATGLTPDKQRLEPSEKIRPILVPWDEAVRAAWSGEVIGSAGLALTDMGSRLILLLADHALKSNV
ncbi:MAG: hypothetical protein G01um1014106_711 [Parcubacteria group bacterium Gr01-1014_106]|nr:MAG: hypothetical protein G01um1014106_711 [Parcubacteria group bacterium Gr01-1014_106]